MAFGASWDLSSIKHSLEPTDSGSSTAAESDIYRSVQSVLREVDLNPAASSASKGMLRWTLHKKVQNSPSNSVLLVRILVKELEKADRLNSKIYIIPLLHTLIYAIIQSVYIPDNLSLRVYNLCRKLLALPRPYSTVGLNYASYMKAELSTPGALYQRKILAEQSLANEYFPFREKVFVFADPAVFSHQLTAAVQMDMELGGVRPDTLAHMCSTVQHAMQATLGESCNGPKLAQALRGFGENVGHYFHRAVSLLALSSNEDLANRSQYRSRMQQLYCEILSAAELDPFSHGCLCDSPLPNPDISFKLWMDEGELWGVLAKFIRTSSTTDSLEPADPFSNGAPETNLPVGEEQEPAPLARRPGKKIKPSLSDSLALMKDSLDEPPASDGKRLRLAGSSSSPLPGERRHFTARIVVMGDDRALGRLAKAYHSLRQREARRLFLTLKLNVELYYIPVSDEPTALSSVTGVISPFRSYLDLASYLSRVDPWYECNISSLGYMIPKMAKMQSSQSPESSSFLVDAISYYTRTAVLPVLFTIYSVKISFSNPATAPVEDVFVCQVELDFTEFSVPQLKEGSVRLRKAATETAIISMNYRKVSLSSRETSEGLLIRTSGVLIGATPTDETEDLDCLTVSFSEVKPKPSTDLTIKTCNIKIRTLENRTFNVCLDKDSRRTFTKVQSIEISPCLDPGHCLPKTKTKSKFSLEEEKGASFNMNLTKGLPLPINTFAGVVQ